MARWRDRPLLEATFLNPPLCAALLASSAQDFQGAAGRAMPWPLTFLVLPLTLHRPTRDALPRNTRTHLSTWLGRHPLLRAGFPERAVEMVPFTREGMRFGLRAGALALRDGGLEGSLRRRNAEGELRTLLTHAAVVGRWLSKTDQASTVFALFGVAP